jgi:peptide/nickel transport system substrate-binding protein
LDNLTGDIWAENPADYAYQVDWRPNQFVTGRMAADYEFTDTHTWVVHLRQDIYWQSTPPASGRQLVASDVVYNYQRLFGLGSGMPGSPYYGWYTQWQQLKSVVAGPDNFTVTFNWATNNTEFINELVNSADAGNQIVDKDVINAFGDMSNWHHAIGEGPFMVSDFVEGSAATLVRNPNYYAKDERHPQNQLPYADKVSVLIMKESATAMAAMRTGKIDIMYGMSNQDGINMKATNPEITLIPIQGTNTITIEPRMDHPPYDNIKVREALQMAINLPEIAQTIYQGNCSPYPSSCSSMYLTGYGLGLYPLWPAELKATYDYNVSGAIALLAEAGLKTPYHTECAAISTTVWDMDVLLAVKDYFAKIGVIMDIKLMDVAAWTSYVRQTHTENDLSFGHSQLGASFEPIFALGMLTSGNSANIQMVSDPQIDAIYARAVAATTAEDYKQAIYDMNYEVAAAHYSICLTTPNFYCFVQPWLHGYNGQAFAADFTVGAPLYGGFYLSRFWVTPH